MNELIAIAKSMRLTIGVDFSLFIEKLNNDNILMMKGGGNYELLLKRI